MKIIRIGTNTLGFLAVSLLLPGCNEELKARIDALNADKAALMLEVNTLRRGETEWRAALTACQTEKSAVEKIALALPVSVRFRDALMGHGLVAILETTEKAPLTVAVTWESAATGRKLETQVNISAQGRAELGHREGFAIEPGDALSLFRKGFNPLEVKAP